MTVIIPTFVLMALTFSMMVILSKDFWMSLPFSIICESLIIMLSGYLGDLRIGLYICFIIPAIAIAMLVLKKRNFTSIISKENIISMIVFLLLALYLCYYHRNSEFKRWDEFSHWGPMIKGMYNSNKLYIDLHINNAHPEYPPLIQCFEYFWCKLSGGYSEPFAYRAISIFSLSVVFPIFETAKNKSFKKQIVFATLFICFYLLLNVISYPYLFSNLEFIYTDFTVAVASAVVIFIILNKDLYSGYSNIDISVFLILILLGKDIGLAFYILSIFTITITYLENKKKLISISNIIFFVLLPLVLFVSWKSYIGNVATQFSISNINIGNVFKVLLLNEGTLTNISVKDNYLKALFDTTIINFPFQMSIITIVLICLIIIFIISLTIYKNKKKVLILNITYILGILGYTLLMIVLYLSCFSEVEAARLASFDRYFSFLCQFSIQLIVLYVLLIISSFQRKHMISVIIASIFIVSISINNFELIVRYNRPNTMKLTGDKWDELYNQMKQTIKDNDRVLVIQRMTDPKVELNLRYMFLNNKIFNFETWVNEDEIKFSSPKEFTEIYSDGYDYVYIYTSGSSLWDIWKKTSNDDLLNDRLYKVSGEKLILVPWISKEIKN